ncbi:MAG: hypothetical protein AAGA60_15810 [Cyanobacteria bacterium P01_E01_bin.42]
MRIRKSLVKKMPLEERSELLKAAWTFASHCIDEEDLYDRKQILNSYFQQQQRTDIQKWCSFTPGDLVISNGRTEEKAESIDVNLLTFLEE